MMSSLDRLIADPSSKVDAELRRMAQNRYKERHLLKVKNRRAPCKGGGHLQ